VNRLLAENEKSGTWYTVGDPAGLDGWVHQRPCHARAAVVLSFHRNQELSGGALTWCSITRVIFRHLIPNVTWHADRAADARIATAIRPRAV